MSRLAAIIPAAGLSSRMGEFKPFLPLGSGTVLAQVVSLFRSAGVEHIIVVTGKRGDEVARVVEKAGAVAVHNPDYEQGMYSSVLAGVRALPDGIAGFFMLPADIPLVRGETVLRLIRDFERDNPAILYPRFRGERGHPPLINKSLVPDIVQHDGTGGLRHVLERHESNAHDLDVADFGVLHDLDIPEDYALAKSLFGREYPSRVECEQLWDMAGGIRHVMEHCIAVKRVAEALCEALNSRKDQNPLDIELVRGAALTHDIGKGTKRHEEVGAELLHEHGFHVAAEIVKAHFDLELADDALFTEKEVVFLADKLVRCDRPVDLEWRYREKMEMYANESGAVPAIQGRMGRALNVLDRFHRETGRSAESVAREALK